MTDDLYSQYNAEVARLSAVLQSVPVAAIAFAMHETSDRAPEWSLAVIAAAVLVWGAAFAAGILNSQARQRALKQAMAQQLFEQKGDAKAAKALGDDFQRSNSRLHWTHRVQVWGILGGALLYAAGHGMHVMKVPGAAPPAADKVRTPEQMSSPVSAPRR